MYKRQAKANKRISLGFRNFLFMSQAVFATITEVFPLPAEAITKFASSSITTDLRCSSVSGFFSIVLNNLA